ncbi:L-threonylcarbamoyladenylate synthase [uncultured Hymenobacter sp.]|uniref:L-threonylcarbamoyladenylate synthase n=1 Tax=uncultured Hymenobacter sp. TaxID=170016 RepID=UPI0035C99949
MKQFREEVEAALEALLLQQIILYPTDTVWGLGCDAEVPRAVERLYQLKGRPAGQPSIVLVADVAMLSRYAEAVPLALAGELSRAQERPTTFILPASRTVAAGLLAPDGTVGLRIPQDEFCHKLLRRLGHGVVSTSANLAGQPAPATYKEVDPVLLRKVDHVVGWRQDDETRTAPSRLVRLSEDGQVEVVRA